MRVVEEESKEQTAFERTIRSEDSDFAKLRAKIDSCCKTCGGYGCEAGI